MGKGFFINRDVLQNQWENLSLPEVICTNFKENNKIITLGVISGRIVGFSVVVSHVAMAKSTLAETVCCNGGIIE